jgi:TrmH family RNA methyltransferase
VALGAHHRDIVQLRRWLRDRAARAADSVFVVEGPRAVQALLDRGVIPRSTFVDEQRATTHEDSFDGTFGGTAVKSGVLDRVADVRAGQGVIAVFDRADPGAQRAAVGAAELMIVLPRINDPGNLGTIARSAQAAGFSAIVIGPGSVDPYNPKTVRAGAGAIGSLPVWEADGEDEVLAVLHEVAERGGVRLGAAADGALAVDDAPLDTTPMAIVVGHETAGLAALPLDAMVRIPMSNEAESLNVAMATTVLCFETARRRRGGRT